MLTRDQFEQLFNKYVDDVVSFLYTYTSDKARVKDWTQEVFIQMWRKRERIDFNHPAFKSYLLKTARNHALKKLKRAKRYDRWLEENLEKLTQVDPRSDAVDNSAEVQEAYSIALSKISRRARRAYLLSREEGLTYTEISGVMDISVKTVETHISKALHILREELGDFSRNS
ncbi:RNA polymerase sigma factor [Fodinibius sp.]|uniref:RNA polymerase sigma factor n=1 Tax=Fodinibius sp. TaxID=1872440 RepID=UPI0035632187